MTNYYVHPIEGEATYKWQSLEEHLENVAVIAAKFSDTFGGREWVEIAGRFHDLGKGAKDWILRRYCVVKILTQLKLRLSFCRLVSTKNFFVNFLKLFFRGALKRFRKHGATILRSFSIANQNLVLRTIDILNTKLKTLRQSHPETARQLGNQPFISGEIRQYLSYPSWDIATGGFFGFMPLITALRNSAGRSGTVRQKNRMAERA